MSWKERDVVSLIYILARVAYTIYILKLNINGLLHCHKKIVYVGSFFFLVSETLPISLRSIVEVVFKLR